ncbi:MAG: hemolysin family protein [Syntrophales bacterium]|nr:hemolysin family protein [Syntrophales bacterium]MCK9527794.1 hemolysin family protein [Syntrophales bacterium]MDX9922109.1 hemolysin family protein [Syntrophales bacterium]
MDYPVTLNLVLLFALIGTSALLSGSEASFFSLTHLHLHKMKEDGLPFTGFVERILERPRRLLVTIMVCNESANIIIASIATSLSILLVGSKGTWVAIAGATAVIMTFCETIPKTLALTYPRRTAAAVVLPLTLLSKVVFPVVWFLEKFSDVLVRFSSGETLGRSPTVMEEDFKTLVDAGHREGAIDEAEKELIHRVFELAETSVADIMTPRVDMFCLPVTMNVDTMEEAILAQRHTRIPLYGTDRDDILGILYTRNFLLRRMKGKSFNVRWLARKPYFVPEERPAHSMLSDFRARKIQMAVVVDEYGGVSGLVTLTDVLNSLFGNIDRERALREKMFHPIDDRTFGLSGMLMIEDFNELMGSELPTEDFDTVGGFVLHLFGQLPAAGEEVSFKNFTFTADTISQTRISWLTVTVNEEGNSHDS